MSDICFGIVLGGSIFILVVWIFFFILSFLPEIQAEEDEWDRLLDEILKEE